MADIVILSCKRIRDITCVSCMKCFKAVNQKAGEFSRYGEEGVRVAALGDCGDCPGLVMPKMGLVFDMARAYDMEVDAIHIGTCIVKATKTAACPVKLDELKKRLEDTFGKPVVIGTHPW